MYVNIKPLGQGLDKGRWRSLWQLRKISLALTYHFWDMLIFHWSCNQWIWSFSSVTYFHVTEVNSVLPVLISLGEGVELHDLKPCSAFFVLTSVAHGLLPGTPWLTGSDLKELPNGSLNVCHTKEIITAIDSSHCVPVEVCGLRQRPSPNVLSPY